MPVLFGSLKMNRTILCAVLLVVFLLSLGAASLTAISRAGFGCCGGWWVVVPPYCTPRRLLSCAASQSPFPAGQYRHVEREGDYSEDRRDYVFFPDGTYTGYRLSVTSRYDPPKRTYEIGYYTVDRVSGLVVCRSVAGHQSPQYLTPKSFYDAATVPYVRRFRVFSDRALTILEYKSPLLKGEEPSTMVTRTAKFNGQCATTSAVDILPEN